MKVNVSFEEQEKRFAPGFSERSSEFGANFGAFTITHDSQNGATFTPHVSEDGVISWTNDRDLPNPAAVNIKGEKGDPYTLTAADKAEIVQSVISSLPVYNGEVVSV